MSIETTEITKNGEAKSPTDTEITATVTLGGVVLTGLVCVGTYVVARKVADVVHRNSKMIREMKKIHKEQQKSA